MLQVFTTVTETKLVAIRITREAKERREKLCSDRRCLVCEKKIEGGVRRGLCAACRQYVKRLVKGGKRTEESLIREGKLLEKSESNGGKSAHEKRKALLDN